MTAPFATKWDFIFGEVLVLVDDTNPNRFAFSTGPNGEPALLAWTVQADAEKALREAPGYHLNSIVVTLLLELMPSGAGITIQPGTPDSMWTDPAYVQRLKELSHPFPGDTQLHIIDWLDIPKKLVKAVRKEMRGRAYVEEVRGWLYQVDDSPYQGILAYRTHAGDEGSDGAANGIDTALASVASGPQEFGLPIVRSFEIDSFPEGVVEARAGVPVYQR